MRGEDSDRDSQPTWQTETPPHAWRRRELRRDPYVRNRNTSTCVEKTATSCGEIGLHHQDAVEFDFLGGIRTI